MSAMPDTPKAEQRKREFSERLQIAMRNVGISTAAEMKSALVSWFRVSVESPRKWLTGMSMPQLPRILDIAQRCRVRAEWLANGTGQMRDDIISGAEWGQMRDADEPGSWFPPVPQSQVAKQPADDDQHYVTIPFHNAAASAGHGAFNDQHNEIPGGLKFRARSLSKRHLHAENLRNVFVRGNSMEPSLLDGDMVILDISVKRIIDGEIYGVVGADGELRLKRLFRALDGRIRVSSDNPDKMTYPDEFFQSDEQMRLVGRFVWLGRFNPKIR